MNPILATTAVGKKYGRQWALRDCTLTIPAGKVVGLVGPNGAGKTTLLQLAAGLLRPTAGTITVLGGRPATGPAQLAKVGFVAQDAPVYWVQARTQTAVAAAALAAAAILAAITGPRLLPVYDTVVATCGSRNDCASVTTAFLSSYRLLQVALPPVLLVLPALIGAFWGAPLVARELESGTFRLAWTQSVTRQRWLAVKLILTGLAGMAVAGLLSLILTWWFSPIDRVQMNQLTPATFGVRGITPIGYAAFAFALGVTAGVFIRRTIPAMAATLVVFTGARFAVSYYVRPYRIAPLRVTSALVMPAESGPAPPLGAGAVKPGDLVVSAQVINAVGRVIGANGGIGPNGEVGIQVTHGRPSLAGVGACPNKFPPLGGGPRGSGGQPPADFNAAVQECINRLGIREVVTYQPLSRYWPLQWDETLIFTGLAIILAGLCFWGVRRRLT